MNAALAREAARQQAVLAALQVRRPAADAALANWLHPLTGPRGQAGAMAGLDAYRRHADALAARALAAVHPVLGRLVGSDMLAQLARHLWREHPPQDGDIGQWGADLPGLLSRLPALAAMPWLADVARLEWALHHAAGAADEDPAGAAGLHRLGVDEPDQLRLRCRAGTQVLLADGPLWSIWQSHQQAPTAEELAACTQALHEGACEPVLVHRAGWQAQASPMAPADAAFTQALLAGQSLGQALRLHPPMAFEPWLLRALRERWLLAIEPLHPQTALNEESPC